MSIEVIRDLIYRDKNEVLLHMFRSMNMAKEAGAPVDPATLEMLQNHLTSHMPLWLAESPHLSTGMFGFFDYKSCMEFASRDPNLLEIMRLIYRNLDNEITSVSVNWGCLEFDIYRPLHLPEEFSHLCVELKTNKICLGYRKRDAGGGGALFSDGYTIKDDTIYGRPPAISGRGFMSLTEIIDCVNHVMGVTDYFKSRDDLIQ